MSVNASIGVSNRAYDGEDTGHSLSKDSGFADLTDIMPALPPKKSPRTTPKVFVKNPSAHKYENQCPLPPGAGSANSTSKKRPDNLAIPSHISSTKNHHDRPVSSVHDYEELPNAKASQNNPRLQKVTRHDDRYTPSTPPIPPLASIPSNFDLYYQTGSDVTMISEGPRKRQNPLYDSAKVISQPDDSDRRKGSDCFSKNKPLWIFLIVIGLFTLLMFILLVLVIIGAFGEKNTAVTPLPQVDDGARNKTIQLEAALQAALKRVNDLEAKVVELDTVLSFIGNTSHNSSLLTKFDELVKNTSSNSMAVSGLDTRVTANTNKITLVDSKVTKFRAEALKNNVDLSDKFNNLKNNEVIPLTKDVKRITTQITSLNNTLVDMQNLRDEFIKLNSTALTDCKLNTTVFESFTSVHNELDTPYVEESASYVVVGAMCSSFGFKTHSRTMEPLFINGVESPYLKYKCSCFNKDKTYKKFVCGISVLLCRTPLE